MFQGVTSIGDRPTFADAGFAMETYILNFEPVALRDDTPIDLEFLLRLRDEKKFDSIEELKAEITEGRGNGAAIISVWPVEECLLMRHCAYRIAAAVPQSIG